LVLGQGGREIVGAIAVVEASEQLKRALDQIAKLPETSALRREQLKLQIALANALLQLKGYAAPEPKLAFEQARLFMERAEAIGEAPEDPLLLFSFLWGVWSGSYVKFNGEAIKALASQFMTLAERQGTTIPMMVGHRLVGMTAMHTGDIAGSRQHFDRAIALYNPAEHRALAPRFGQDIRVAALAFRARALWLLGYPALALADLESALQDGSALFRLLANNKQSPGNYAPQ
jgi:predicted ATPase